jgi:hypothetical protein
MSNIQINASVSKTGILTIPNRKRLQQDLKAFSGSNVEIIIKKRGRRSSQANRFYWGCVIKEIQIRLNELGNDLSPEDVHDILKYKFNKANLIGEGGEVIDSLGLTTTDMNKEQFGIYLDKIIEWAASFLSITIPLPDSKLEFQF